MLSQQKYASIGTKKHNGSWVWTPVWMACLESKNAFYLFSAGAAGKVKRVRNYAEIQVAPCTVSGKSPAQRPRRQRGSKTTPTSVPRRIRHCAPNMGGKWRYWIFSASSAATSTNGN